MTLVFTNGCFDLVHPGHVDFLERARALGDRLVVGLNSDASVRAVRGAGRPLVPQEERAAVLRGLRSVDEVVIFDEPTPARLINELRPDVLVKGGDWTPDLIIGGAEVELRGGRVLSLPLYGEHSTSRLLARIRASAREQNRKPQTIGLVGDELRAIVSAAKLVIDTMRSRRRLFLCGDGTSAFDAQQIAGELAGRRGRLGHVFARQLEEQAVPGDVLIAISTSGNAASVLKAAMAARTRGCRTIALTGLGGKRLASLCDVSVIVPSDRIARIRDAHIAVGHIWRELVDTALTTKERP